MNKPLLFSVKLDIYRRLKKLTINQLATKVGVSADRMEKLLEGSHEPRGGDVVRIERSLSIQFDPSDFEVHPTVLEAKP